LTETERPHGTGVPVAVLVTTIVATLLVGAAVGMLVTLWRVDSDAPPGAGSVDVGFAQDMSVHHQQAVTLAGWARDHSTDQEIVGLAFDIESTQQSQVGMMQGWLSLWNQPLYPSGGYMTWMPTSSSHENMSGEQGGVARMPGMATQEEITRLRSLTGKAMDVYFLQLILRHHAGGAEMALYAGEHAAQAQVRALASSIHRSQTAEMGTLRTMLTERGAQPLPS
jgi:uncharacterized protein (DUF305 family)